ncbi:MAG: ATP synthase F1 subunit delta [Elusimicrobiota bacterium]|jgi:F-type H+-transporting ATPase subunit delta
MKPGERVLARRYAAAFVAAAARTGVEEQAVAELSAAARGLSGALAGFRHPRRTHAEKRQELGRLAGSVSAVTLRFLELLLEKKRIDLLPASAVEAAIVLDERRGILRGKARTAAPLPPEAAGTLAAGLSRFTGRKVVLETETDEDLIAGASVRAGDWVLDGSLRGRLKRLSENLSKG